VQRGRSILEVRPDKHRYLGRATSREIARLIDARGISRLPLCFPEAANLLAAPGMKVVFDVKRASRDLHCPSLKEQGGEEN
jgi:hypothetical protein